MGIIAAHVVQTPGEAQPYKVVLQRDGDRTDTEHPVGTVSEGETLIRKMLPARAAPEPMREWTSPVGPPPADPMRSLFGGPRR